MATSSFLFALVLAASVHAFHSSSADDFGKAGWISFEKCMVFAPESVELPSQETGTIASLSVRENDSVAANQVIGKLDGKIAELEENAAGLQRQVATSEAMDESEIRLAEAFVEETKLQADQYEEMAAKGNASRGELKQRQLAAEQAKVRLGQSKTAKQQRELKSKLAQSAFVLSQQKVERLTMRSPIAGTVTRIDHRAGEWVQSGTTVVKIIRLDEVRIDCFVNIDQLDPSSLVGKSIKVLSKRGPNELIFSGRITSYDPDVTGAGQVRVHATVQNQKQGDHWMLLPGMSVSMQLPKS
ncbi:MAG: HlyD family efflux transporter periplasmic adaptor subunit [Planctomycetota bacterium]|nr:HlyD family efflux transporter periplasmic adaptor subunit [Planctomycetota bacterium]